MFWAVFCVVALAVYLPVIMLLSVIALIAAEKIAAHTLLWSAVAGSAGAAIGYSIVKNTGGDEITLAAALLSSLAAAIEARSNVCFPPKADRTSPQTVTSAATFG